MEKIMRQSGADSNRAVCVHMEGMRPVDICDDGSLQNKTCYKLNQTFFKHFRTLGGYCNNIGNPMYGTKGSRLSRVLPADQTRFEKPTFFKKPQANGKLIIFIMGFF
jgi:hypothetical protein